MRAVSVKDGVVRKCLVVIASVTLSGLVVWYNGFTLDRIDFSLTNEERSRRFLRPHHAPLLPNMPVVGDICKVNSIAWDCVGLDREWGLVFIDHRPGERRTVDVVRMLTRSVSLVIHDTEQPTFNWPLGWLGRRNYTERTFLQERKDAKLPQHLWSLSTTLIQGDLDKDGSVFDQIVKAIQKDRETIDNLETNGMSFAEKLKFEKPLIAYGTHLRLVRAAASFTQGDILEFGSGLFSTPDLDNIVKASHGRRMMVSADTDLQWLRHLIHRFSHYQHQFMLVPAYSDLEGCYKGRLKEPINISAEELELLGNPAIGKKHFLDANC